MSQKSGLSTREINLACRAIAIALHGGLNGNDDENEIDIQEVWKQYKKDMNNVDLRNKLVEKYMPLVRYNGERIRARLPEGVELDDLISAGIFG